MRNEATLTFGRQEADGSVTEVPIEQVPLVVPLRIRQQAAAQMILTMLQQVAAILPEHQGSVDTLLKMGEDLKEIANRSTVN